MRVGATQDWPEFIITEATLDGMVAARSASSSTMLGDLPPSSWCTRLTVEAAVLATSIPARVEPVIEIMSMPGWAAMAAPTSGPVPLIMLNTPAGMPAASTISAKIWAEKGAISDGFSTTVQPVARAGPTLAQIWFIGQFQGVMKPTTPIGSFTTRDLPRSSSNS